MLVCQRATDTLTITHPLTNGAAHEGAGAAAPHAAGRGDRLEHHHPAAHRGTTTITIHPAASYTCPSLCVCKIHQTVLAWTVRWWR